MVNKRPSSKRNDRGRGGQRGDSGDVVTFWKQPKPIVHKFTRVVTGNEIVKLVGDQGFGVSFTLADLPGYTEFQALFDQYRLDWIEYMFILRSTQANSSYPIIYFAEDHDDTTNPSFQTMAEASNTQIAAFGSNRTMIKFRVTPNVLRQVYNGVTSGYERAPPGVWLDCANSGIPHYGVKYAIQNYNSTTTPNTVLSVNLRYHVSFKETI